VLLLRITLIGDAGFQLLVSRAAFVNVDAFG
jgi:hypothetical protein